VSDHPGNPAEDRPATHISIPVIKVDISAEQSALRASDSYRHNDHASKTLVRHPGLGVILIALPKGGHMAEHQTAAAITFSVLERSVKIDFLDQSLGLGRGDFASLQANTPHRVTGLIDSALLLTIGGS